MSRIKILFLAANPVDTDRLRLDKEHKAIARKLETSHHCEEIELSSAWATTLDDWLLHINKHQPHIVHFCGHGNSSGEIILEDDFGRPQMVPSERIENLFKIFKDEVRVVVLNACFSLGQANAIVKHVDCAIGVSSNITDDDSILFSATFYQAIGYGRSLKNAYEQARFVLDKSHTPSTHIPQLIAKKGIDPENIWIIPKSRLSETSIVNVEFDRPFEEFTLNEQEHILSAIKELLSTNREIRVRRAYKGSVHLEIEIPTELVEDFLILVKTGEISGWQVLSVKFADRIYSYGPQIDYTALFRTYITNSIQVILQSININASSLEPHMRKQVMHLLSYAIKIEEAWPQTRNLFLRIAPLMEQTGQYDDWEFYLQEGIALSQQQDDISTSAELLWQLGRLYRLKMEFDPAQQYLSISANYFAQIDNSRMLARAYNELGYIARLRRQPGKAQEYATAALAMLHHTDVERAESFFILGLVAIDLHDWQMGETYFREALALYTRDSNLKQEARIMQYLGISLQNQGDYPAAISYYQMAIHISTQIQDVHNCGIAQINLSNIYSLQGEPSKALNILNEAESIFRSIYDLRNVAIILTNKGQSYLALGEWQQAKNAFVTSAALYKDFGEMTQHLNALDGLALAHMELGDYEAARIILQTALDQISKLSERNVIHNLERKLKAHLQETYNIN